MHKRSPLVSLLCLLLVTTAATAAAAPPSNAAPRAIRWQRQWHASLFAQAARKHRFVLLDLHAVWCHWCHVMDSTTYADAAVAALIGRRYLPVSVDADSDPALAARYGDWGWPATIVFAADGTEIVKRRGYIPPAQMASLLQAIIDDPSPGPSVRTAAPGVTLASSGDAHLSEAHLSEAHLSEAHLSDAQLTDAQRDALRRTYEEAYDARFGGWGSGQKFLDAPTMEYTFARVMEGRDRLAARRARQTLDANLALIDPVWGGVYQYSATPDWATPHYEKLLAFQADDLRLYSEAYTRWHDPRYLNAARALEHYMTVFLESPDGAFYVSQDADVSAAVTGRTYYALGDAARRRRGFPRVDTHEYARENGWAIRGLCSLYEATGEPGALAAAVRAADWVLAHRALAAGGFRHDERDSAGPYLEDTLSMGEAFVALYHSGGDRRWLTRARAAMDYITSRFRDARGGYVSAPALAGAAGVFAEPTRALEQNADVARFASLLQRYTAEPRYREAALHAMTFLAAATAASDALHADVLLADHEVTSGRR